MNCPCGSQKTFEQCCQPFIEGKALPPTPEALMRSRYTAFTRGEMEYIESTLAPEAKEDFDLEITRESAKKVKWRELRILEAGEDTVEFVAVYEHEGNPVEHHEISRFRKTDEGRWLYVDGDILNEPSRRPVKRETPKLGRNDPCSCGSGSGKKYKKCCGA